MEKQDGQGNRGVARRRNRLVAGSAAAAAAVVVVVVVTGGGFVAAALAGPAAARQDVTTTTNPAGYDPVDTVVTGGTGIFANKRGTAHVVGVNETDRKATYRLEG